MAIHLINDVFANASLSRPLSVRYLSYQFWSDVGDPRVAHYYIARAGPLFTLTVIGIYLCFSIYLGPKLMANRRPLKLRRLIFCYNIIMVAMNLYFLLFVLKFVEYGVGLFVLRPYTRLDLSATTLGNVELAHQLFMSKFIDLLDTVFFVLRKKQNHVSVLHLYHHSAVPILFFIGFRLLPVFPPLGIFALINCSIHVLMYSYYALASFGPRMQPYLWWKKYITQIQMIQFVIYAVYAAYCSLIIDGIPFYLLVFVHMQSPIFLILFGHFYIKAYMKTKNKVTDDRNALNNKSILRNKLTNEKRDPNNNNIQEQNGSALREKFD